MKTTTLVRWLAIAASFLLTILHVQAQIPVASLFQTPLLVHPAMAGNTGKHRLALLANQNDYYVPVSKEPQPYRSVDETMSARSVYDKASNLYASYDQLAKGYGIGGFVTYSTTPKQTNSNATYRQDYGQFSANEYSVGLALSPKLRIPHPILPGGVKYTIAPSLMLGYKGGNMRSQTSVPKDNYYSLKPTVMNKDFNIRQLNLQAGLMANSDRGYIGYNLGFIYDFTKENNVLVRDTLNTTTALTNSFLAMQHSVCLGLVFPKKEGSLFTFSPLTVVGISNPVFGGNKSESIYLTYVKTGLNWYGYLHQSLNFRLKWVLFGAAYTEYMNQRLAAYHVGFKNKALRCTVFYSFWDTNAKMEASINITF